MHLHLMRAQLVQARPFGREEVPRERREISACVDVRIVSRLDTVQYLEPFSSSGDGRCFE